MKDIYAIDALEMLERYETIANRLHPRIQSFLTFLNETYSVRSLPRCIIWTDKETATHWISDIPIPAYTNDFRTVFCPELEVWRELYLQQLPEPEESELRRYYETELTENHLLQILGHEYVHHSDLFLDAVYEQSRWFEEGMCEYISRRFFLTEAEFERAALVQQRLVTRWEEKHGKQPMESFDASTYRNSYGAIFYEYWRSFLAVNALVDRASGNVWAVFRKYHDWYQNGCPEPLVNWFQKEK